MFSARNASPGLRFRNSAGSATASYFGSAAPAPAAEIVNGVADRVRAEMYHNIGLADLLAPLSLLFDPQHCRLSRMIRLGLPGPARDYSILTVCLISNCEVTHLVSIRIESGFPASRVCRSEALRSVSRTGQKRNISSGHPSGEETA
jgi:hypothetical protein